MSFNTGINTKFDDYTIDGNGAPAYSAWVIDEAWLDVGWNETLLQLRVVHEVSGVSATPQANSASELVDRLVLTMQSLDLDAEDMGEIDELTPESQIREWAQEAVREIFGVEF